MARNFGNTWWGERWLDSLTHIDYENRIPRGARYARNGSVKEITFGKDGTVKARVQGSRPSPYKIELKISQFDETQKKKLIDAVAAHPVIMSKLLNRELDPEILKIAEECGLKIFPSSWRDIGMQCSCPDWAVPCKHIAAVIYKISQEIDNNPFVVMSIHGLDLAKAVQSRGLKISDKELMAVTPISAFLQTEKADAEETLPWELDMSRVRDLTDDITDLLAESPAFMTDFRESFRTALRKCQKSLAKNSFLPVRTQPGCEMSASIGEGLEAAFTVGDSKPMKTEKFLELMAGMEFADLSDCQPSAEAMFRTYQLARTLVLKGCAIPQIVQVKGPKYRIIWLPATMDREVRNVTDDHAMSLDRKLVTGTSGEPLKDASKMLLSAMMSAMIHEHFPEALNRSEIHTMFFQGSSEAFSGLGETNIPGNIKSWLSPLHLSETEHKPFIQVTDKGDGFGIILGFETEGKDIQLSAILSDNAYNDIRYAMLQQLSLLLRFIPGSSEYVDSGAEKEIFLSDREFTEFLRKSIPAVRLLGIKVVMPKSLLELAHPKPTLKMSRKESKTGKSFIRLEDLIGFEWRVAIGNETVSEDEFRKLVRSATGLIRFRKSFFLADEKDIMKINEALSSSKGPGKMRILQAAISGEYEGSPVIMTDEVRNLICELTSVSEIPVPDTVKATLRPYQCRGYSWMYKNMRLGFGSIIADDMGLGKTVQVIALLAKMKQDGALDKRKALLAVPTGLLTNWESELDKFCPTLSHFRYHGSARSLNGFSSDILLTTYGVLRSDSEQLSRLKWEIMVIDEAQNIKNTDTAQTKAVKSVPADIRIAMSGTPVENRLSEYWSIMDYTNKGYLDTKKKFEKEFAEPIQIQGDTECAARFRRITAPFMMRRLKTDKSIIDDLPDKTTRNFSPVLTPSQAALYQEVTDRFMEEISGCGEEEGNLFKRQGIVLQMILALKQICDHPGLFLKDGKIGADMSGKCGMLLDLVSSITDSGEKVLIFTQFKEMGDILQKAIEKELGIRTLFYHGGCSLKQRNDMVNRFQEVRSERVFILSLKAAGTGLNLTAASHVIHFDLWWNPAVEQQATDRAYRIGQHKNVIVTRFVTAGTFEERIDRMIDSKKALSDMTVATGESWIGKLSDRELKELVRL